jgi:YidC/Oxa1 family membrane protein insertase
VVHHGLLALAGLFGSVPLAIVVATLILRAGLLPLSLRAYRAERVRAGLAPQLARIKQQHKHEPVVLAEKTTALMRAAGSGPFAGLLPMLMQAPFVWLLYREFTNGDMHGYSLLGADLTQRLIGNPGLLAGWLIVFVLAAIALWNVRQLPVGSAVFVRVLTFGTVAFAPFVPVAAGIYLVTTGLWTAAERWVCKRVVRPEIAERLLSVDGGSSEGASAREPKRPGSVGGGSQEGTAVLGAERALPVGGARRAVRRTRGRRGRGR